MEKEIVNVKKVTFFFLYERAVKGWVVRGGDRSPWRKRRRRRE